MFSSDVLRTRPIETHHAREEFMFSSKLASHSSPIARRALKTALLGATALMLVCAPAMAKTGCESSGAFCGFDKLAPSAGPLEPGQHNEHNGVGSQHGRQSGSHHQGGGEGSSGRQSVRR
jgi:hypothetical protein